MLLSNPHIDSRMVVHPCANVDGFLNFPNAKMLYYNWGTVKEKEIEKTRLKGNPIKSNSVYSHEHESVK